MDKIIEIIEQNLILAIIIGCLFIILIILIVISIVRKCKERKKLKQLSQNTSVLEQQESSAELDYTKIVRKEFISRPQEVTVEEEIKIESVIEEPIVIIEEEIIVEEEPIVQVEIEQVDKIEEKIIIEETIIKEEENIEMKAKPKKVVKKAEVAEEKPVKKTVKPTEKVSTPKTTNKEVVKKEESDEKTKRVLKGKIEIFNNDDFYQFAVKASNGEVLLISDLYKTKQSALTGAQTLQSNLENVNIRKVNMKDKRGQWQFKFINETGRAIALSANYETEKNADAAAVSLLRFAVGAPIIYVENSSSAPEIHQFEIGDIVPKKGGKIIFNYDESIGYYFQLAANNGAIICTSEIYKSAATCKNGVETLKSNIKTGVFIVLKDKRGFYEFKLYNSTLSRVIAAGESYNDKNQAIASAKSVASFIDLAN